MADRLQHKDFKKLPKGTYAFDNAWGRKQPVKTSVGTFQVEFMMLNDKNPPDDTMLSLVDELVEYVETHSKYIRDVIYGSYRYYVTEEVPISGESCGVPADLKPEQIWKHCNPVLVVERNPTDGLPGPPYECRIIVYPKWEPEHNLSLEFRDGAIVTVNQVPFRIVKGILRYEI
jgi:hypothetical protein